MKYDYFLVQWKRGDQTQLTGLKDGMPVDIIDPNNYNPVIQKYNLETFFFTRHAYKDIDIYKAALLPNQDIYSKDIPATPTKEYRARNKLITFSELGNQLQMSGLEDAIRSKTDVDIIDCTELEAPILKDSTILNPAVKDLGIIAGGNCTVGGGGAAPNYLTYAALGADIAATFTSALNPTQVVTVTETGTATFTSNMDGFSANFTSLAHNGNPKAGYLINIYLTSHGFIFTLQNGTINIENWFIKRIYAATVGAYYDIAFTTISNNTNLNVENMMLDGNSLGQRAFRIVHALYTANIFNIKVWDYLGLGIWLQALASTSNTENCFVRNCIAGLSMSVAQTIKNCMCINNATADFAGTPNAVGRYNASSDLTATNEYWGTGSGNQVSINPAVEVETVDDTLPNFGKSTSAGVCGTGGIAPSIPTNTTGEWGNERPGADGLYSIGTSELSTLVLGKFLITIPFAQVGAATHTNFPVLVDNRITTIPAELWEAVPDIGGLNIKFYSADELTEYSREIVNFTPGGILQAWVKIPSLSHTVDTQIMCVVTADTRASDVDTWNDNYVTVHHFSEFSGNPVNSANPGTYNGAASNITYNATGKLGRCFEFNGNNSNINLGDVTAFNAVSNFTISFWMNQNIIDLWNHLFIKQLDGTHEVRCITYTDGKFYLTVRDLGLAPEVNISDYSAFINAGSWYHIVMVYDGAGATNLDKIKIYINGVNRANASSGTTLSVTDDLTGVNAFISRSTNSFNGKLDDYRIKSNSENVNWILTEYTNQNNPDSFMSCGAWQVPSGTTIPIFMDNYKRRRI